MIRKVLVLLAIAASSAAAAGKYNVLFIAADDLNNRLPCYGYTEVKAPNTDRLAKVSMRFDSAYCQYPLCNPSRTSLLTGLRPDTTKVIDNETPPRTFLKETTWMPEYFHANGYFTARVGKIAHGQYDKVASRWDEQAHPQEVDADMRGGTDKWLDDEGQPHKPKFWSFKKSDMSDEQLLDGASARTGAKFLEDHKDQPFFIGVGFHRPHLPWGVPKKYFDLYPPSEIKFPPEPPNDRDDIPKEAIGYGDAAKPMSDAERRAHIAAYYASISFMDAQLGIVLDAMDRLKLWDKTIVVFWGDHGYMLGEHGLQRKQALFEQACRVPLLIHFPGHGEGKSSKSIVECVDVYPTLAQAAGLEVPKNLEGTSFAKLFDDPDRKWKKAAFTQTTRPHDVMGRTVRTERWRYTEWGDPNVSELYDHDADPGEYTNLAKDPKYADLTRQLHQVLMDGWKGALPEEKSSTKDTNGHE
jgi:uncharacterized sulfatase